MGGEEPLAPALFVADAEPESAALREGFPEAETVALALLEGDAGGLGETDIVPEGGADGPDEADGEGEREASTEEEALMLALGVPLEHAEEDGVKGALPLLAGEGVGDDEVLADDEVEREALRVIHELAAAEGLALALRAGEPEGVTEVDMEPLTEPDAEGDFERDAVGVLTKGEAEPAHEPLDVAEGEVLSLLVVDEDVVGLIRAEALVERVERPEPVLHALGVGDTDMEVLLRDVSDAVPPLTVGDSDTTGEMVARALSLANAESVAAADVLPLSTLEVDGDAAVDEEAELEVTAVAEGARGEPDALAVRGAEGELLRLLLGVPEEDELPPASERVDRADALELSTGLLETEGDAVLLAEALASEEGVGE